MVGGDLYSVDPDTGTETLIGSGSLTSTGPLTWDGRRLLTTDAQDVMYEVDRATGATTFVSLLDENLSLFDLAPDARGVFFATSSTEYYTLETTSGTVRERVSYSPSGFQHIAAHPRGDQDSDGLADIPSLIHT